MKALGLTSVGMGGAALLAPTFHDLDEVISSSAAFHKRPWYVKERDLFDPTIEVDWDATQRFDRMNEAHTLRLRTIYMTKEQNDQNKKTGSEIGDQRRKAQKPGYDHKFQALQLGNSLNQTNQSWTYEGLVKKGSTNADLGLPKWTGTPEEASRLVNVALRFFGMTYIGFAELDNTWRNKLIVKNTTSAASNLVYTSPNLPVEADQLRYVYEDVPKAYSEEHKNNAGATAGKLVIPTKSISLLVMAVTGSAEARKCPSAISDGNRIPSENFHGAAQARLYTFLRALGDYQVFGLGGHQEMSCNCGASTVLTGIAEAARQNNYSITPEQGPHFNPFNLHTDLPLAPTKPIDAGMWRFCASCGKCADWCPSYSIPTDKQPSWDIPLTDGKPSVYHNPGLKAFWANLVTCRTYTDGMGGCGIERVKGGDPAGGRMCYAACVFGEDKEAMVHAAVRGVASTTGLLNGFFARMSDAFGYGYHEPDDWWNMSLPAFGMDTTVRTGKGGYSSY
ncbi:MAG: reductive dehalogenase [Dehalogenimonas sp.]